MFKRKKIMISIAILVMMLAMTVTAFASSNSCSLHTTANSAYTSGLTTDTTHSSGRNNTYSTDTMKIQLQVKRNGVWESLGTGEVKPGHNATGGTVECDDFYSFRTKIYTKLGNGGVEGIGCIYNW